MFEHFESASKREKREINKLKKQEILKSANETIDKMASKSQSRLFTKEDREKAKNVPTQHMPHLELKKPRIYFPKSKIKHFSPGK